MQFIFSVTQLELLLPPGPSERGITTCGCRRPNEQQDNRKVRKDYRTSLTLSSLLMWVQAATGIERSLAKFPQEQPSWKTRGTDLGQTAGFCFCDCQIWLWEEQIWELHELQTDQKEGNLVWKREGWAESNGQVTSCLPEHYHIVWFSAHVCTSDRVWLLQQRDTHQTGRSCNFLLWSFGFFCTAQRKKANLATRPEGHPDFTLWSLVLQRWKRDARTQQSWKYENESHKKLRTWCVFWLKQSKLTKPGNHDWWLSSVATLMCPSVPLPSPLCFSHFLAFTPRIRPRSSNHRTLAKQVLQRKT